MSLLKCLLLLLTVGSTFAVVAQKMVFTNLSCTSDTKYWNVTMWLNDSRLSFINVAILPTIGLTTVTNLYINTGGANEKYTLSYTKHMEICKFLGNPMSDPLTNLILQTMAKNKNNHVTEKCPIAVDSYWVKDFILMGEQLPIMMSNWAFYLTMQIHHLVPQRKLLLDTRIDGEVEKTLKKRVNSRRRI